jgi:hypothetical protein
VTATATRSRWFAFGLGLDDVDETPALRPGYLSRHVLADQMRSKGNGEVRAHPALLARLDALADRLGAPIPIISGYRDPAYNAALDGAASQSQHMYATAADIDERYGLTIALADELGFSGRGNIEGTDIVVHVDVRAEGPGNFTGGAIGEPTTWEYPA